MANAVSRGRNDRGSEMQLSRHGHRVGVKTDDACNLYQVSERV